MKERLRERPLSPPPPRGRDRDLDLDLECDLSRQTRGCITLCCFTMTITMELKTQMDLYEASHIYTSVNPASEHH